MRFRNIINVWLLGRSRFKSVKKQLAAVLTTYLSILFSYDPTRWLSRNSTYLVYMLAIISSMIVQPVLENRICAYGKYDSVKIWAGEIGTRLTPRPFESK